MTKKDCEEFLLYLNLELEDIDKQCEDGFNPFYIGQYLAYIDILTKLEGYLK